MIYSLSMKTRGIAIDGTVFVATDVEAWPTLRGQLEALGIRVMDGSEQSTETSAAEQIRRTADRIRTTLVQSGAYTADTFYLERVLIREMSRLLTAENEP